MELQLGDTALVSPGLFESLNLEGNELNKLTHRLPPNTVKIDSKYGEGITAVF